MSRLPLSACPRSRSPGGHRARAPGRSRRRWALLLGSALLLGACAGRSPSLQWVQLPVQADAAAQETAAAAPARTSVAPVWALDAALRLPDYLDRDAVMHQVAPGQLQALPGWRWAEPLRESLPRLLALDLAHLRGGADRVWRTPLPPGVVAARQLRLDVLAFERQADGRTLRLLVRWSLAGLADGAGPAPLAALEDLSASLPPGAAPPELALAHRRLIRRLAECIASAGEGR